MTTILSLANGLCVCVCMLLLLLMDITHHQKLDRLKAIVRLIPKTLWKYLSPWYYLTGT